MTISQTIVLTEPLQFQQFQYPAGEWQVRLPKPVTADEVRVIARIRNGEDMMRLALLRNAIGNRTHSVLSLPYLPYSRADRQFTPADCCGLEVFGKILQSMQWDAIETLDVHNPERALFYVPGLINKSAEPFIKQAIADFARRHDSNRITVLFPDEGARTRYKVPAYLACNTGRISIDIAHCQKKRDPITGALEGFDVPEISGYPTIIVDDICDGGGTFVGIAEKMNGALLGLYVTHGIFSKGLGALTTRFDHFYTTDSFAQEGQGESLTVFTA